MDRFTDSGPEEVLRLDDEYNKANHVCPYDTLKSNGDIGIEVASKYIGKNPGSHNPPSFDKSQNYSSEDDSDTEFSSMSLVALAAKHKTKPTLGSEENSAVVSLQNDSLVTTRKTGLADSSDSSSDIEGSSLFGLMRKHKSQDKYLSDVVDGSMDIKVETQRNSQADLLSVNNLTSVKHEKVNVNDILDKLENLEVEEMSTKFVAAQFSDDSDSDEPLSLMGLAMKHAQSSKDTLKHTNQEGSGSADDVRPPKPNVKELQSLVNYNRQHTKSESDRFSFTAQHPTDSLLKKGLENNVSTSLRSLGGGNVDLGFQFSLGGSIPGSFKSLNASNSLSSSLASVRMERVSKGSYSDINNAYSDSDVSIEARHHNKFEKNFDSGSQEKYINSSLFHSGNSIVAEFLTADMVDGGINLSCALKKSTSRQTSESLVSEDGIGFMDDDEDEQIVTLLDSLMVDEEVLEEEKAKSKKRLLSNSELDESCMVDATHLLNIKVKIRTRRCSAFGKVLCRHWRLSKTPYIRKEKVKTNVIPFDFVEPSPDDVIAYAFKRRL